MKSALTASLVAEGTSLSGDFSFIKEFLVAGTVNGSVSCSAGNDGIVKILDGGILVGEIHSPSIEIFGKVEASITSTQNVIIGPNAEFTGIVQYRNLSVCAGAVINGALIPMVDFDTNNTQVSQTDEADKKAIDKK